MPPKLHHGPRTTLCLLRLPGDRQHFQIQFGKLKGDGRVPIDGMYHKTAVVNLLTIIDQLM